MNTCICITYYVCVYEYYKILCSLTHYVHCVTCNKIMCAHFVEFTCYCAIILYHVILYIIYSISLHITLKNIIIIIEINIIIG